MGETLKDKADKVKWKVEHRAGQLSVYLLTLPANEDNLLDIIPAHNLLQKGYPKTELFIIGIERGYEEAANMAAAIIREVYEKTGAFDVKQYVLKQESAVRKG